MEIQEVALSSFVLVEAPWPPDQSHRLISDLEPTHIIVHHGEPPQDSYYLLQVDESVLGLLEAGAPDLDRALGLGHRDAVPLVAATEEAERAPDRCVVHEEGLIIGFFDADFPPAPAATRHVRRGAGEPVSAEPGLVNRDLRAELPKEVEVGVSVSLLVSIGGAGAGTGSLPIALPAGTTVDVVVQPRRGFEVEGRADATLQVGEEETLPVQFKVRGTELGPGELRVLAFHQGQALGAVTLRPLVVSAAARADGTGAHSGLLAPVSVRVPDVTLLIDERNVGGKPGFLLRLTAPYLEKPHNLTPFGPVVLESDAAGYFDEFFRNIEGLPLDDGTQRAIAEQQLRDKGAKLFERVFPPELRKIMWGLRDRSLSMLVQSEEPWIPWELCRLFGEVDGDIQDGPFLCEAFTVTRWQPGVSFRSPLRLTNMALVVPGDSGLALASVERDAILALADGGRQVSPIPANFLELQDALASGEYDGWHFTGHGAYRTPDPNKAVIVLEKKQKFTPDNLAGTVRRLGRSRPLVFFNACQTGRAGMSLTGMGGWAREFLTSGAGAFIGTYWSVFDRPACDFAKALYARLLGGEPIGKAVQGARAAIRNSGDPTWLAYTVFADPMATLEQV